MSLESEKTGWRRGSAVKMLKTAGRVNAILWPLAPRLMLGRILISAIVPLTRLGQTIAMAIFVNELVLAATNSVLTPRLVVALCLMIIGAALPSLLYSVAEYISRYMGFKLDEILSILICKKNAELDIAFHEEPKKADLVRRVEEGGLWRVQSSADRQFYLIENGVEFAINIFALAAAGGWVFLVVLLGTIPEFLVEVKYGRDVWGIWQAKTEVKRRHSDLRWRFIKLSELIEMKLFQSAKYLLGHLANLFLEFQSGEQKAIRRRLDLVILSQLISQCVIATIIIMLMIKTVEGGLQIGTFLFCIGAITTLRSSLSSLFVNLGRQIQDLPFVRDVLELLDSKPSIMIAETEDNKSVIQVPVINFVDVSFSYPGNGSAALHDLSLTINPGEKIAIVGLNGSGKTTLVKLLCRFYDPTSGYIKLDDFDLRQVKLSSWYKMLGVVFQEFARYHFPVKEAIALGDTSHPLEELKMKSAAEASGADKFILEWENKYDQMLGNQFEGGKEPSVGQWQKLALSRLFYRGAGVMILDEPTSAIDAEAEEHIFNELSMLPKDQTVILISHRFSTVRKADRILVFDAGRIIEEGSHEQLVAKQGRYAELFELQAKGYR